MRLRPWPAQDKIQSETADEIDSDDLYDAWFCRMEMLGTGLLGLEYAIDIGAWQRELPNGSWPLPTREAPFVHIRGKAHATRAPRGIGTSEFGKGSSFVSPELITRESKTLLAGKGDKDKTYLQMLRTLEVPHIPCRCSCFPT